MKNSETKVQNPHDKFFKDTFSNPLMVRDFVENYLPEPILKLVDLNELEIQNGSHVDEELSEVFSDMLFRTKINERDSISIFCLNTRVTRIEWLPCSYSPTWFASGIRRSTRKIRRIFR
jgi:predicted transposase YdaD